MNPLIKIHGGKHYIKNWIIEHFPIGYENMTYIEPFIGGGSVLLNKKRSTVEIINDIDSKLINIYKTLVNSPISFMNQLETYKYSYDTFKEALRDRDSIFADDIDEACNEYIIRRMSRGGLGKEFAWSNRERNHQPGDLNAWQSSLINLHNIYERLIGVTIYNTTFKNIINSDENTFIYCDPPYLQSTRTAKEVYDNEMSDNEHIEMLRLINKSKAKILLSGYESLLYNFNLKDWNRYEKVVTNHSAQSKVKSKRIEILWSNY